MKLAFATLCLFFVSGRVVSSIEVQSTWAAQNATWLAKGSEASGMQAESECLRKEELRRRELDELANRVERSALMRASATGRIHTVRALIKRGVAVNKKDAIGLTALMLAAGAGHVEVTKALLAAGADPNAVGGIAHGPIFSVMTMAMTRSNKNRMQVIDALIAAGAQLNPSRVSPITPLTYAIQACDVAMIQALLEKDADPNWNRGAPLIAAATNAHAEVEIVRLLLAAGADPNLPKVNVGGDEKALLSYLEQVASWSRDGVVKKRDKDRNEILQLLKKAGAKH